MRLPSPSRLLFIGALAVAGVLSGGVGIADAQLVNSPPSVQPSRGEVVDAAVREASLRFGVPEPWIRAVMRVESANNPRAVSGAGAIGLMQVMPATYAALRRRHVLGPDPFDLRDNILAGTAYLREMHDRYGRTGMLAAYNAGPGRWEEHLRGTRRLPLETRNYLARLGPAVGAPALGLATDVPIRRSPNAPPQTVFVSFDGGVAATAMPSNKQRETAWVASEQSIESVFVSRTASTLNTAGDDEEASTASSSNPLFAPVGSVGGVR